MSNDYNGFALLRLPITGFKNKTAFISTFVLNRVIKMEGQVILNKVCILGIFSLNRVRDVSPQRLIYTQILVEYSLRGSSF